MKHIDLFAGIGGFSIGFEREGIETIAFVESDAGCRDVLRAQWNGLWASQRGIPPSCHRKCRLHESLAADRPRNTTYSQRATIMTATTIWIVLGIGLIAGSAIGLATERRVYIRRKLMGYFPNGTAGESYHEEYCSKCLHDQQEGGCPIWFLHGLHNYDECNKPESFLHVLIPRSKDGIGNRECSMFLPSLEDQVSLAHASRCPVCDEPYHGAMCGGVSING